MSWKHFNALPKEQKLNEAHYILGLDVGNNTSAIAFYNLQSHSPESIDLSGGFGKQTSPTVVQYVEETAEWVFGEVAMLNYEAGVIFDDLVSKLGQNHQYQAGNTAIPLAHVLGKFIAWLAGSVTNINPRAEIVGIVASVPSHLPKVALDEYRTAIKHASFEDVLIDFAAERACVLAEHYAQPPEADELALILDFGSTCLRGGLCLSRAHSSNAKSYSFVYDDDISTDALDRRAGDMFREIYASHAPSAAFDGLAAFTHTHKDILFGSGLSARPHKLYFNFAYPPFFHEITREDAQALTQPLAHLLSAFVKSCFEKNISAKKIGLREVKTVLCVGGGFEMQWARQVISGLFPKGKIRLYKSPKLVCAMGAARLAAGYLGLAGEPGTLEDAERLAEDIGIYDGRNFYPLAKKGGFWWQKHAGLLVLVNEPVDGAVTLRVARRENIAVRAVHEITLRGLPKRPKGTTRLLFQIDFPSYKQIRLCVRDMGFGELFPAEDFYGEYVVDLEADSRGRAVQL